MTNRSELLTLVAAALKGAVNNASEGEADECGNTAVKIATAALKAMDEVSATVNSSQVDSSHDIDMKWALDKIDELKAGNENLAKMWDNEVKQFRAYRESNGAEIARLDELVLTKDAEIERLIGFANKETRDKLLGADSFAAYRERMESPLTEAEGWEVWRIRTAEGNGYEGVYSWDAAIRKVREGRKS